MALDTSPADPMVAFAWPVGVATELTLYLTCFLLAQVPGCVCISVSKTGPIRGVRRLPAESLEQSWALLRDRARRCRRLHAWCGDACLCFRSLRIMSTGIQSSNNVFKIDGFFGVCDFTIFFSFLSSQKLPDFQII